MFTAAEKAPGQRLAGHTMINRRHRTGVPETAVHKNRQARPAEHEIGLAQHRLMPTPAGDPLPPQQFRHRPKLKTATKDIRVQWEIIYAKLCMRLC